LEWLLLQINQIISECDSTNHHAKELGLAGAPHRSWVAAKRQTAGRGRQGRTWISEEGNLFLSMVVRVKNPELWTWVPLVSAVGVLDALRFHPRTSEIRIKWPNDLWFQGQKLAGFLCEGVSKADPFVVIGLGLNCQHAPENGVSLSQITGKDISPDQILPSILKGLGEAIDELVAFGPDAYRKRYSSHSFFQPGDRLTWNQEKNPHEGTLVGLGRHGELIVQQQTQQKTSRLFAEDVDRVRN